jgi:hypothetical protein
LEEEESEYDFATVRPHTASTTNNKNKSTKTTTGAAAVASLNAAASVTAVHRPDLVLVGHLQVVDRT